MKCAVILFHKNIERYPSRWVGFFLTSIKAQSYSDFTVYEIDYGGTGKQVYEGSVFESKELNNHAEAHNYLLDKVFSDGYDVAFNTNVDDYYSPDRIEKQLKLLKEGYDVVSSNFNVIDKNNNIVVRKVFHNLNIAIEARKGHNIIAHPVCAYSKNFWTKCTRLNGAEIPKDDFELWKRSYRDFKFKIMPDYLLYYRIHENNSGKK